MIISDFYKEVKNLVGVFAPGGEDRATLRSDLSAPPGPSGVSTSAFYLPGSPDGFKAINLGGEAEGEGAKPPSSISLDNCEQLGIFGVEWLWRPHSDWGSIREAAVAGQERVADVLEEAGRGKEASKVRECCRQFRVYKARCCGDNFAVPYTCDHRLCPVCMKRRAARLRDRILRDILPRMKHPVHIVLTVRNVPRIDKAYYSWLRGCFTKLRHRKLFEGVAGGGYSIETTWNVEAGTWHVHLHVLADADWILQQELSRAWDDITGSPVVWITAVGSGESGQTVEEVAREIAKYVVKPGEFLDDPFLLDEYLKAVRGMRLFQTFGDFLGVGSDDYNSGVSCVCGLNLWVYVGDFPVEVVYMDEGRCFRRDPDWRAMCRSP